MSAPRDHGPPSLTVLELKGRAIWVLAKGFAPDEGGMQTYAEGVAQAWAAKGAKVTVFTQTSAGPRLQMLGNVRLVDVGSSRAVPLRLYRAMRKELRLSGPPLFTHGTTWRTSSLPLLLGLQYITTFHGREFMRPLGLPLMLLRRVASKARLCVAVSHYSARHLQERLGPLRNPVLVAWNGLSGWDRPARKSPLAGEQPLIVSLCRLEPRKNIAACIDACAEIRSRGHRFRYVIAGRGPESLRIAEALQRHELGDCVSLAGFVTAKQAAQLYADADIFLHPQIACGEGRDFEGFGIAIADAMAAGAAAIVGAEGGAKELILDEAHGLIVNGESTDEIASALEQLLQDPARRTAIAQAGLRHADKFFSWDRHVTAILSALTLEG